MLPFLETYPKRAYYYIKNAMHGREVPETQVITPGTAHVRVPANPATVTRNWSIGDSTEEKFEKLEKAINALQSELDELPSKLREKWRSDYEAEVGRLEEHFRQAFYEPLKRKLEYDLSKPRLRNSGVIVLLIGIVLTIAGNVFGFVS